MSTRVSFALVITGLLWVVSPAMADTSTILNAAIDDYQHQKLDASRQKLNEVLKNDPENIYAHYYLGIVLYQKGKNDKAIVHLEKVANSPKPLEGVEGVLAGAYLAAGHAEKALPYFTKAYQANPDDETTAFQYASSLQGVGKLKDAKKIYKQLVESKGEYADPARYQLGQMLAQQGSPVAATRLFRAINPHSPYAGAAQSYLKALEPSTKPFSVYASAEYFYNNNPGSASANLIQGAITGGGSQGVTLLGVVSTRNYELTDKFKGKLSYMYYGTFHQQDLAKDNDFVGHFINPVLSYKLTPSINLDMKGEIQFFFFNQQMLSTNLGTVFTATWTNPEGQSLGAHFGFLQKFYTGNYLGTGAPATSLEYLDAKTWSAGLGATLVVPGWGASIQTDYTFNNELTDKTSDPQLGAKALDSRFIEHAISVDVTIPLPGILSRFSILGNLNYSYKDYLNQQSGQVYPSVTGQNIKVILLTRGVKAQVLVWEKFGLTLAGGAERTTSHSLASEVTYESNKYYGQLSANF